MAGRYPTPTGYAGFKDIFLINGPKSAPFKQLMRSEKNKIYNK